MSMPLFDLTGKVAVVTGGSSGIGRATATALAQSGAGVVIAGIDGASCIATSEALGAAGFQAMAISCDVRREEQLTDLVKRVHEHWGSIDILVCNAGVAPHAGPLAEASDHDYELTMDVNLRSVMRLCNLVIPGMARRGGGSVVIVSSIAGVRGNKTLGLYGLSKAANTQLARNLAIEWGPSNVRVNAVSPGVVTTDFAVSLTEVPEVAAVRLAKTPLRRFGTPEEVAGAIVFLAAPAGAFITGHNLIIDGGTTVSD